MLTIEQINSVLEQSKIQPRTERINYYQTGHRDLVRTYFCSDSGSQQRYSYFYPSDLSFERKANYQTTPPNMEIAIITEHPGRVAFCIGLIPLEISKESFATRIEKIRQELLDVKRSSLRSKLIKTIESHFPLEKEYAVVLVSRQHVYLTPPNTKKFIIVP